MFVHYGDLLADTEFEMRRIAAFLDIEVDDDLWPVLVADVGIDAMRAEAGQGEDSLSLFFRGGTSTFFNKGTNGRWRDVLTDDDLAMYDAAATELEPELRAWLEHRP
jgi:aryl sulfotransferase